ncbi:phosphoribosylformylglycinamidine synthase subunit PurL [Prochlorococcus sp. MIT 1300]|uniref:phosphoribosylformylglycinamidine synthase subunit PurL n=1 Tax=Prochlorococcus sp. MIT 1300 TaxID=3096218 RepID=UPI002A7537CD|nr:phosphoribosylformylglycinamidine synthase subunit PurL [Prochlorococcus sp. MIT 1300]
MADFEHAAVEYNVEQALRQEGLKPQDYDEICRRLNRQPNRVELGMFGVMWSEHCCYRNSKPLLSSFPTDGPQILVGPGENAGVVDLGEGQHLVFKIESHNHPSAVEPFQGAATGVGGILRDIFTMGARPIALLNALRFGPLDDDNNISLMEGVVSGIAHYGNCVGVPTVGGEVAFDSSYSGNPLVNAMALGLMETDEIVCSGAQGIDYPVLYVGSTTGRDGMGGASFASAELTDTSLDDRPAVQVGDPFLEKGLIEACLEVFKTGDVVAAQDMGAAGLTCSCSEMAAKGGLGIELDLDLVPARELGMSAYEFLLSESQERMLFVVKPGKEEIVMSKFKKWDLHAAVVGRVLEENVVRVIYKGKLEAEIPASALADDTPIDQHELTQKIPSQVSNLWNWNESELPLANIHGLEVNNKIIDWNTLVLSLLDSPTIGSKRWVYEQYDYQVQANTLIKPGDSDAAIVRLRSQLDSHSNGSNRAIAAVVDCPNKWVYLDPERGSEAAVAEAARNLSCVGAKPLAVTDNLNFSSPQSSLGYWQLAMSCKGISNACKLFETPVTGGNVSLYNETKGANGSIQPIQPTPVIGMVGLVDNIENIKGQGWHSPDDNIYLLGVPFENSSALDSRITLSGSNYLEVIHGKVLGRPPTIDIDYELLVQNILRDLISQDLIQSAHDLSDGGLAVALSESSISSGLGADINLPKTTGRIDRLLFAEGGPRILLSVSANQLDSFKSYIENDTCSGDFHHLGIVSDDKKLLIRYDSQPLVYLSVETLTNSFEGAIPSRIC